MRFPYCTIISTGLFLLIVNKCTMRKIVGILSFISPVIGIVFLVIGCTDHENVIGTETVRDKIVTYEDVKPIFQESCAIVGCHIGPGAPHGLQLDSYENILKGSAQDVVVVAGYPREGELIYRITGAIPPAMPLNRPGLDSAQVELIRLWIIDGLKRE
jgi:hypothetical protein